MVDRKWEGEAGNGISPAPFLSKTYQLVDDPSTNHIVSWGDDRISTFVVWRPPEFARDLLPNYFKHNNFSSFVRQLNTYGFRKVVPERWEFANDFFRRGEKHLLCEIHRRKTSPGHPHFDGCDFPVVPCPAKRLLFLGGGPSGSAAALIDENDRLRRRNAALVSELAHMRRLYNDIIYFVQTHVRPVSTLGPTREAEIKSGGSATSSSSLTLADPDPQDDDDEITPNGKSTKIFGVHFCN